MIVVKKETISPDIARAILLHSRSSGFQNRRERPDTIERYAKEMRNAEWKATGDTIKITEDGILIDGYHRLEAICKSGVAITLSVARGVNKDTFDKIDQGNKRSRSDLLYIKGFTTHTTIITSAAHLVCYYLKYNAYPFFMGTSQYKCSLEELEEVISIQERSFIDGVNAYKMQNIKCIKQSIYISMWVLLHSINTEKADVFFAGINNPSGLNEDDPRYMLREVLMKNKLGKLILRPYYEAAYIVSAWNAFCADKKVKILKKCPENDFPAITGFTDMLFFRG